MKAENEKLANKNYEVEVSVAIIEEFKAKFNQQRSLHEQCAEFLNAK